VGELVGVAVQYGAQGLLIDDHIRRTDLLLSCFYLCTRSLYHVSSNISVVLFAHNYVC